MKPEIGKMIRMALVTMEGSVMKAKICTRLYAIVLGVIFCGICSSQAALPLLQYTFDETGTTVVNSGTLGSSGNVTMMDVLGTTPTDLHGDENSGIVGTSFDNSGSAFGVGKGAIAKQAADNDDLDGLYSFTIAGWFKTSTVLGSGGYEYIALKYDSNGGFGLNADAAGRLRSIVRNSAGTLEAASTPNNTYTAVDEWMFIAQTWDGSAPAGGNDVTKFYIGTPNRSVPVSQVGAAIENPDIGATGNPTDVFAIGNYLSPQAYAYIGHMDQFAMWCSQTDGSGVLSLEQIEAFRINTMPPPKGTIVILR